MPKDVTPHSMRHSLASLAADMGVSDHLISGLLGHSRRNITSRYMHLSDGALIETADKSPAEATLKLMKAYKTGLLISSFYSKESLTDASD